MRPIGRSDTHPAAPPEKALGTVEQMMREGVGLRLLLARLPAGASLEDARRLRERILQSERRPSRVMRGAADVERA